jgi:ferric-dicitrate binding protein FerR (iron transport regulator)
MRSEETIHIAIVRLFSGEASDEDKKLIEEWKNKSSNNHKLFSDLKLIWDSTDVNSSVEKYNLENAIRKFRERIRKDKQATARKLFIVSTLKYAAIALLVISLPVSYYFGGMSGAEESSYTTITCALGDKTEMVLPDDSKVWLNSGSKLTFNNNFKRGEREVLLEGEAYFSVTKDKENPFRVKTSEIEVEVLGTEFNLKAYSNEKQVAATLIEGSIKISSDSQSTVIEPGFKLVYNNETNKMELFELTETSTETEWKEGRLVFRNESLQDMELKLERWFDVDIVFADEAVKKRRFTGTLERESILEVVSYLSLSRHVGHKIDGNKIIFYSKKQ